MAMDTKRVPISEISEVQEVVDLRQEIEAVKAQHPDVFMKLADLIDRYNAALEVAENKVRSEGVSCGPFDNFSTVTVYDPQKMYEELGEELFMKCGGSTETVTEYKVDTRKVDAAIATNQIPKQCVSEFSKVQLKYHKPGKISL